MDWPALTTGPSGTFFLTRNPVIGEVNSAIWAGGSVGNLPGNLVNACTTPSGSPALTASPTALYPLTEGSLGAVTPLPILSTRTAMVIGSTGSCGSGSA